MALGRWHLKNFVKTERKKIGIGRRKKLRFPN